MPQILATFPTLPQTTQIVTLEDVQYQITMTWRARLHAWYLDLLLLDGTELIRGRRVSPGADILWGCLPTAGRPPGSLYVRGDDPYDQDMLGERVLLVYYASDELPAAPAAEDLLVT